MGRLFVVIGLLVALTATASCSAAPTRSGAPAPSSLPTTTTTTSTTTTPCETGQPGHLVTTPTGEAYTTATAPCTSTTTTTTLPAPLALGTTTTLTYGGVNGVVSGQFTVDRVWMNATPEYNAPKNVPTDVTTLSEAVHYLLLNSHLPLGQQLMWIGVDLAITNTGNGGVELGFASGPGADALYFVVNGSGPSLNATDDSGLLESGFEMGVPGFVFPFASLSGSLNPGQSISGCVALAVPVGVKVSTVGFDLQPAAGGPVQHVAQWSV